MIICLLTSCSSNADTDRVQFEKDTKAVTDVRRVQATLSRAQNVAQGDLEILKRIHAKYPDAAEVRQVLQTALLARQDWGALEKLVTETSEPARTSQEQLFLAKVYIKLGKYADASRIVGPMADADPKDLELNSLAGHAWYFEGKYDDAIRALDRVWDAIVASKQVDEMMMRAMIYFYKGDKDRAAEILKKTVEMRPDFVAGINALSRVYAAKGDQLQAEVYRSQAENAHARQTAQETRQMRVVSRSLDLESAFAGGRYQECIQIAREVLQYADEAMKPVLYEYLGKSYEATGQQTEAQTAFQEASRLRGQAKS